MNKNGNTNQKVHAAAKFQVGVTYKNTCWFTGGTSFHTVVERTENTLVISEAHDEIDGFHVCEGTEVFEIHEEDGREYIVLYSYHGHENRIYAGNP